MRLIFLLFFLPRLDARLQSESFNEKDICSSLSASVNDEERREKMVQFTGLRDFFSKLKSISASGRASIAGDLNSGLYQVARPEHGLQKQQFALSR